MVPNSLKIWYGFHSFYLASSHRSWARIAPGLANIAFNRVSKWRCGIKREKVEHCRI